MKAWSALAVAAGLGVLGVAGTVRAGEETDGIMASGAAALHEGRAGDAIAAFEALADRGVVDPVASYDRGLAYAWRVRIGAEVPGDLGRAVHGFEEARELSRDPRLVDDASRALTVVRSEVARRRARAGQPVEVEPGRTLSRSLARLLGEDTWGILAVLSSAVLSAGMFVRWLAKATRGRVAGAVAAALAAVSLAVSSVMALALRHDREHLREAVVVVANARPTDDHGLALPGGTPLPEGARVEVVDTASPWPEVRFGAIVARVGASSLREIARAD